MSKKNYQEQVQNSPYAKNAREIGQRLYTLRTEKKLSVDDLVAQIETKQRDGDKQVKLSKTQYSRFENGTAFMNSEIMLALCDFYHIPADFLLYGKETLDYNVRYLIKNKETLIVAFESLAKYLRNIQ